MLKRIVSGVLSLAAIGNGALMVFAGERWFSATPSVTETGPYNPHFVADVGAAFIAGGLGLAMRAWRPQYWPAAMAGAVFFALHALIHVVGVLGGHSDHATFEWVAVILPSAAALWAATPDSRAARV